MPMYNILEYSSNSSDSTGNSWFYSKHEENNFNADIVNTNNFKASKYKGKLLANTEADGNNGILKSTTIAVPFKYLSNFWGSLEMSLIHYKVELKIKLKKHCAFAATGADNDNANSNDIIFTIKNTKLYVPVIALSAKDIQKLLKLLSKNFERSIYCNEYNAKSENNDTTNE